MTTITFSDVKNAEDYSTYSVADLMKIRDDICNAKASEKHRNNLPAVIAALRLQKHSKVPLRREEIEQHLFVNGVVRKNVITEESQIKASYTVERKLQDGIVAEEVVLTELALGHVPFEEQKKVIDTKIFEPVYTNALFLQACRILASFFSWEKQSWKLKIGDNPFHLNANVIPQYFPVSHIESMKLGQSNLSGNGLYRALTAIKDEKEQQIFVERMSGFVSKLAIPSCRKKIQFGNAFITQIQSYPVPREGRGKVQGLENFVSAKLVLDSARQKMCGNNYWEVNNDYVDGVQLAAPYSTYRDILRCVAHVKWDYLKLPGKKIIGFVCTDGVFAAGFLRVMEKLNDPSMQVRLIGMMPGSFKFDTTVNFECERELNPEIEYTVVLESDYLPEPSVSKTTQKSADYFNLVRTSLELKFASRTSPVMLMCPYANLPELYQHNLYDPSYSFVLTTYYPPRLLKKVQMMKQVLMTLAGQKTELTPKQLEKKKLYEQWGAVDFPSKIFDEVEYLDLKFLAAHMLYTYVVCHSTLQVALSMPTKKHLAKYWAAPVKIFDNRSLVFEGDNGTLQVFIPAHGIHEEVVKREKPDLNEEGEDQDHDQGGFGDEPLETVADISSFKF